MAKSTEFELLGKIGEGGMGEVYRARLYNRHGFEKIIAAKKVLGVSADQHFMQEAEVLSKLNHNNICSVFDIKEYGGSLYILMEYIDGLSLSALQSLAIQKGWRFSEDFLYQLAFQVLKGLEYAHLSIDKKPAIIHRDISPQNIMITNRGLPKILDFGVAKIEKTNHTISREITYGKVRYCAPEVLVGGEYSQSSDLYALGVLLFELSIGNKAFDGLSEVQILAQKSHSDLNYDLVTQLGYSEDFKQFLEKISASVAKNRFDSANEALSFILDHGAIKMKGVVESTIVDEIEKLRAEGVVRTKTVFVATKKKSIFRLRAVTVVAIIFLSISIGVILFGDKSRKSNDFIIQLQTERGLVNMDAPKRDGRVAVGGELGMYISDFSCISSINSLLAFPSSILRPDVEKYLGSTLRTWKPNQFLKVMADDYSQTMFLVDFLKKNCSSNEIFNKGVLVYEDLHKIALKSTDKEYANWTELRFDISPKVFLNWEKYYEFHEAQLELRSEEMIKRIRDQFDHLEPVVLSRPVGYKILQIEEGLFPTTLKECRDLFDFYWIVEARKGSLTSVDILNFEALIVPKDVTLSLVEYGPNYVKYADSSASDGSLLKKLGVCVFKREKGEVVESSFRRL